MGELGSDTGGHPIPLADLQRSRAARKSGFGAKAGYVVARRSRGIEQSFRQRRPATADEMGGSTDNYLWSATKPYPWALRARNRRRSAVARASRKANR